MSTPSHPTFTRRARGVLLACALGLGAAAGHAFEFEGSRTLTLHGRDGRSVVLGQVQFTPKGDGSAGFAVQLDVKQFTDHFLSMKEFKCIEGDTEIACHVPYPYKHPGTVSAGQLAWLEHSLLFLFKQPKEFGAKLWNGLYFAFKDEGSRLVGTPESIDLTKIGVPPDDLNQPPYPPLERGEVPAGTRWAAKLVIE